MEFLSYCTTLKDKLALQYYGIYDELEERPKESRSHERWRIINILMKGDRHSLVRSDMVLRRILSRNLSVPYTESPMGQPLSKCSHWLSFANSGNFPNERYFIQDRRYWVAVLRVDRW